MNAVVSSLALFLAAAAVPEAPSSPPPVPAVSAKATASESPESEGSARVLTGEWPPKSVRVTLDLERVSVREALKQLAAAAHWGITFKVTPRHRIDATFHDVPADQALASILKDEHLVAEQIGRAHV